MKTLIALILILLLPLGGQAAPTGGYAMVDDADGYVNLRAQDRLQSVILNQLPNGTLVSAYCDSYEDDANFCLAFMDKGQFGYIYKDRLSFFEDNSSLIPIPFINHKTPLSASYVDHRYKVSAQIEVAPVIIYPENFSGYNSANESCPHYYDQVCSFGLEGFNELAKLPENYYKFSKITFSIAGKTIKVPDADLEGLFLSDHAVSHNDVFTHTNLYFDPISQHLYLLSLQSYGAGTFTVIFKVESQGTVTRQAWLEAL